MVCDNVYYWLKRKGFDLCVIWNGNKDLFGEYLVVCVFFVGLSL